MKAVFKRGLINTKRDAPFTQSGLPIRSASGTDLYAAALSLLCLVHCLALPLITSIFPLLGYLTESERVHQALVLLAAPATLWAAWNSRLIATNHMLFIVLALSGLTLLIVAGFIEALEPIELWLTVLGALCLTTAHLWRWFQPALSTCPNSSHLNLNELSRDAVRANR